MAKKYYAIKKGYDFNNNIVMENVIVESWAQCLSYVKGASGAVYKSFLSKEEAKEYLNTSSNLKKGEHEYPLDIPHIYVDGSYNARENLFGYGLVVVYQDVIIYAEYGGDENHKESNQRQVQGELKASIAAMKFAIENKFKEIVILYDYEGVCSHATGAWERKNKLSESYYEQVQEFKNQRGLNVIFVKVDSHTGDLYNDMADELSKVGAKVSLEYVVDKAINGKKIKVKDCLVKEHLQPILKMSTENLEIQQKEEIYGCKNDDRYLNLIKELKKLHNFELRQKIKNIEDEEKDNFLVHLIENYL